MGLDDNGNTANGQAAPVRMTIGPAGKFSWHGKVDLTDPENFGITSGGGSRMPLMRVGGKFLSNTTAKVTVSIHAGSCHPVTTKMRWLPHQPSNPR